MALNKEEFLKTADSITNFAMTLQKLKTFVDKGAGGITLSKDEAQSIIWAMQILRQGENKK